MTPRADIVTVELPGTRDDALEYFQQRDFSSVPVIKQNESGEEFRGLVSRESLIEKPQEDQLALLVEEVPTVTADTEVEALCEIMVSSNTRRVPVVDGKLEGMVTVTDVIRALAEGDLPGETAVGPYATKSVITTYQDTPLHVVQRQLFFADVPYLLVLDAEAEMAGIVTEVDILEEAKVVAGEEAVGNSIAAQDAEWMWEGIKAVGNRYLPTRYVEIPEEPVKAYMTADLETTTNRTPIGDVARVMIQNDIEQIPLISGDDLDGIVLDMDLLKAIHDC